MTQKQLSEWEDCFADIVNVLLLNGKRLIKPRDLKPAMRTSLYKDKNLKLRLQERDVAKLWEQGRIRLAFIGLEDQISVHRAMPLRVIGYDGAVYRDELNRLSQTTKWTTALKKHRSSFIRQLRWCCTLTTSIAGQPRAV